MKNAEAILASVLAELKRVSIPGSINDAADSEYWMTVEARCDNATSGITDTDTFHKKLIIMIEGPTDDAVD